jgi:hypothetical protein
MSMFMRTIDLCAAWLAELFDDADDRQRHTRHWLLPVAASFLLAAAVVALTTMIVLWLDGLLHTQLADTFAY